MNKLLILLVLIIAFESVSAATLHGNIYDEDFNLITDVVVSIDSEPEQIIVSKDGSYFFQVGLGNYTINAEYYSNDILLGFIHEEINIIYDNDYIIDLILVSTENNKEKDFDFSLILIFVLLLILIFLIFWKKKPKEKKKHSEDSELNDVLDFIKKQKGRVTQKEIRKALLLSEAKASLILTELEHKNIIERIKKGRGNVIILKNKKEL